jgi:hypothetical protein
VTHRRGLQLAAGDLFVMASIDSGEQGPIAGRVVVSESATRLALFTGELIDPSRAWMVPPLACERGPEGELRFAYDGPLVAFPSHTPFLDLEHGLAAGELVEGRIDLRFRPADRVPAASGGDLFGDVRGELAIDGRRHEIASRGVATDSDLAPRARVPYGRITLPDAPNGPLLLATEFLESAGSADRWRARDLIGHRWADDARVDLRASATIDVSSQEGSLVLEGADDRVPYVTANLERVIPVRRPGPRDTVVETRFALVRDAGRAVGWVEVSVVLAPSTELTRA